MRDGTAATLIIRRRRDKNLDEGRLSVESEE